MTSQDRDEFKQYLRQCTDAQVLGVYAKEIKAGRRDYALYAEMEADRRSLETK